MIKVNWFIYKFESMRLRFEIKFFNAIGPYYLNATPCTRPREESVWYTCRDDVFAI